MLFWLCYWHCYKHDPSFLEPEEVQIVFDIWWSICWTLTTLQHQKFITLWQSGAYITKLSIINRKSTHKHNTPWTIILEFHVLANFNYWITDRRINVWRTNSSFINCKYKWSYVNYWTGEICNKRKELWSFNYSFTHSEQIQLCWVIHIQISARVLIWWPRFSISFQNVVYIKHISDNGQLCNIVVYCYVNSSLTFNQNSNFKQVTATSFTFLLNHYSYFSDLIWYQIYDTAPLIIQELL